MVDLSKLLGLDTRGADLAKAKRREQWLRRKSEAGFRRGERERKEKLYAIARRLPTKPADRCPAHWPKDGIAFYWETILGGMDEERWYTLKDLQAMTDGALLKSVSQAVHSLVRRGCLRKVSRAERWVHPAGGHLPHGGPYWHALTDYGADERTRAIRNIKARSRAREAIEG
jgi:hypothetical protein